MIRRFNYTGRKKIEPSRVAISIRRMAEGAAVFDADLRLEGLGVPEEASVYVEAYYKASFMRFDFGTVSDLVKPANRRLTDIGGGDVVFFRVRVVDLAGEHGRLLAEADGLMPRQPDTVPANRRCLLHVNFKDLGEEVWRLEFDNSIPVLEVNDRIENIRDIVLTDRTFRSLVYPAAVREVLQRILIVDEWEAADDDGEWASLWLRFARRFHAVDPPRLHPDSDAAGQERLDWIEDAVRAFCRTIGARESFSVAQQEARR